MNKEGCIKALEAISQNMDKDSREFDGQPFTGKVMAKYNAKQGAAITALADILKEVIAGK